MRIVVIIVGCYYFVHAQSLLFITCWNYSSLNVSFLLFIHFSHGSHADVEASDDDDDANGHDDIGHKKLKQWDEDNKAGAGPGAVAGGNDIEIEDETGQ